MEFVLTPLLTAANTGECLLVEWTHIGKKGEFYVVYRGMLTSLSSKSLTPLKYLMTCSPFIVMT